MQCYLSVINQPQTKIIVSAGMPLPSSTTAPVPLENGKGPISHNNPGTLKPILTKISAIDVSEEESKLIFILRLVVLCILFNNIDNL